MRSRLIVAVAALTAATTLWPPGAAGHTPGPLKASVKTGEVRRSGDYAVVRGKIKVRNTSTGGLPPLVSCKVLLTLNDGRKITHADSFSVPPGSTKKKRFAVSVPDFEGEVTSAKGRVKHCHR